MKKCPNKGCENSTVDIDPAKGTSCCTKCGRVLEENATVTEITFAEGSHGQVLLVGQHVGADGRVNAGMRLPGENGDEAASFLRHGRQDIYTLTSALGLKKSHADQAISLFKMAVQLNFVKGRKIMHVSCACLYTVCRKNESAHMLIDFSEVVKVNVFKIAAIFLKFIKLTSMTMPLNDPSLYIHRFVGQLKLEDGTSKVANTALRLVARMKRDWMATGRRPSGLCGAAIIIACRMHNFFRSKDEVVRIVRVSPETLKSRLLEFGNTASAYLTTEEINAEGGDDGRVESLRERADGIAEDPPCFKASKKKRPKTELTAFLEEQPKDKKKGARTRNKARKSNHANQSDNSLSEEETDVEDISEYMNDDKETQIKTLIWEHANQDYIQQQQFMEKLRVENPSEFKKRYPWKLASEKKASKRAKTEPTNLVEAAGRVLENRSSKINYDVLNTMLGGGDDENT